MGIGQAFNGLEFRTRLAIIVTLVAVAMRGYNFGNPIVDVDETFYLVTSQYMLDGAVPFVDIWDRKPIGLFLIYLLPALFPGRGAYLAYQLLALLFVILTALMIARLAERAGWKAGALPAALAYIIWLNLGDGQGGQAPVFYNLLMVGAAWAVMNVIGEARPGRRLAYGLGAMVLAGLALQIKYSVLFEGIFFGLYLLFQEWKRKTPNPRILLMSVGLMVTALIPTLVATAVFVGLGYFDAFYYANFTSIFDRHAEPFPTVAKNFGKITAILAPLLILAYWRLPSYENTTTEQETAFFLKAWLSAAVFGLVIFGTYFSHYSLPVMAPAACCTAGFFAWHRFGRQAAVALLMVIAVISLYVVVDTKNSRGSGDQIRAEARQIGSGEGCLFDYTGQTILFRLTGRCHLSKYIFASHLFLMREYGAIGVPQEIEVRRILDGHPEVIVMTPQSDDNQKIYQIVADELAHHYHLEATMRRGRNFDLIYRLNGAVQIGSLKNRG